MKTNSLASHQKSAPNLEKPSLLNLSVVLLLLCRSQRAFQRESAVSMFLMLMWPIKLVRAIQRMVCSAVKISDYHHAEMCRFVDGGFTGDTPLMTMKSWRVVSVLRRKSSSGERFSTKNHSTNVPSNAGRSELSLHALWKQSVSVTAANVSSEHGISVCISAKASLGG